MKEKTRERFYETCVWGAPIVAFMTAFGADNLTVQGVLAGLGLSLTLAILAVATKK